MCTCCLPAPPHLSPSKLAQYIKGRSSRRLQKEFPELRKRNWGQHLWARGYFCATVGAVAYSRITRHLEEVSAARFTALVSIRVADNRPLVPVNTRANYQY
jgi:REP element-mobilizing transposase RayT